MESLDFPTTAAELGEWFGAQVLGDARAEVRTLSPLASAGEGSLSFLANRKYSSCLNRISGAVIFTDQALMQPGLPLTYLVVSDPQAAFAKVANLFRVKFPWIGISPQAIVHPTAEISEGVSVGPFAIIGERVRIGKRTTIHPYAYVGADCEIGSDCEIHPRVTLWDRVRLGDRVKVFTGSVLGSDGFGFLTGGGSEGYSEMPQIGTVIIEDDVRMGANCTVDRGTLGPTVIGKGSKLDDQVHVGHNCRIGVNVILCAQVGLGGSAVIEDGAILGGQAGIGHGVVVGKGARLGGQCGSSTSLKGGETYFMTPATPISETVRIVRYMRKLPEIWRRLKRLEEQIGG